MPGILFPTGMLSTNVNDESIFMIYAEGSKDGKPQIIKAKDILKYLTGSISTGNDKFPTGGAIAEMLGGKMDTNENLSGYLAQFDPEGQLVSGGNFDEFTKAFADGLTKESIFR